jgi:dienelactone hydrolase
MKVALFILVSYLVSGPLLAAKPPIDFNAFDDWPTVQSVEVSSDGQYAEYVVGHPRAYVVWHQREGVPDTLVMRALKRDWTMETDVSGNAQITRDGLRTVFVKPTATLCVVTLGTSTEQCVPTVDAFKLVRHDTGEWLVYQVGGASKDLIVRDLATGCRRSFAGVLNYWFSGDGHILVLQTRAEGDPDAAPQSLQWVRLPAGAPATLWRGSNPSSVVFDSANTQLAFMVEEKKQASDQTDKSLWYYRIGQDKAALLADNRLAGIEEGLRIDAIAQGFSKDGNRIFISLREKAFPTPKPDAVKVDVWSYKDARLQSEQLSELTRATTPWGGDRVVPRSYVAVVPIHEPRLIRLEQDRETLMFPSWVKSDDSGLILREGKGTPQESNWNRAAGTSCYWISTKDGNRKEIVANESCLLSPEGRYVVFMDKWQRNMFSYEVATGAVRNLTRDLPIPLIDKDYDKNALPPPRGISVAGFMENDSAVLVSDRYDIWRLDLAARQSPVDVTNGYGRRHNIEFGFLNADGLCPDGRCIAYQDKLVLSAFNKRTKDGGFYSKVLGTKADPELLTMGPYSYQLAYPRSHAGNAQLYAVRRENAAESPNFFVTRDFKTYTQLSWVYPERAYNWLTTELLSFRTANGRSELGVLYKPENFDPTRKYPVILNYYEKKSDELDEYQRPLAISAELAIPWFVSRGYLVFTPDIHYTMGHPGRSALDSVVSAARRLAEFPWVDSSKMGIQGHSWGGFETNYIVTHTSMFAAAMSSSGLSDNVSDYDAIMPEGHHISLQYFCEIDQTRIGSTLWQRPDLYIENSPIFRANKVATPILMMSNKGDGIVPFAQGVEFFLALRRLGKKAWMLQYDGQNHTLVDENAERQHTIRVTQFFDYYLKGAPPPRWMTVGIPARLKGIETGLELDTTGAVP